MRDDSGPRLLSCIVAPTVLTISLTVLGYTAGGLALPPGGDLGRCTFSQADAAYSYPGQPAATADPPYSSLFEHVCINIGTERQTPQSGFGDRNSTYTCACCGAKLFSGEAKFDSGTGWPSFWAPYDARAIGYARDLASLSGVELHCARCKAHLGHVFPWDRAGQANPTGLRYCIDGVCMRKAPRATGESGGVHLDNPYVLHELLILVFGFAMLLSCVTTPVACHSVVSAKLKQVRERRRSFRIGSQSCGQRIKSLDSSESTTRPSSADSA